MQSRTLFFAFSVFGFLWVQDFAVVELFQLTEYGLDAVFSELRDPFFMLYCVITVCASVVWRWA